MLGLHCNDAFFALASDGGVRDAALLDVSVARRSAAPDFGKVVAALAAAQSVALHVNMRRYVTGTDSQGWNLNSGLEWWWEGSILSPMLVWAIGSLAFAALLVVLVREVARRHEALA